MYVLRNILVILILLFDINYNYKNKINNKYNKFDTTLVKT